MSSPFSTLLCDNSYWDLVLDSNGNIALAAPPYAVAQDVASALKTFLGEVYYDTSLGVPYLSQILGQAPPLAVFKAAMVAAALTVPSVASAVCIIEAIENRAVTAQVQFTTTSGLVAVVGIASSAALTGYILATETGSPILTGPGGSEISV